jgi:hypothetical protein
VKNIENLVEISQAVSPDGRRRARFALHEIYPDETKCNLNGITYLEEYTRQNADSVVGMPICATFLDEDKEVPYDHGYTGNDSFVPLFEDSVQVGTADGWSIEDIEIEGETHRVLVCDCYINQSRYPKFVEWLETQKEIGNIVRGSVEFVGTKENKEIIYKDGKKYGDEFRVPISYTYSGFCILTAKPSDSSAIMLEFNQLNKKPNINKNNNKQKEDNNTMDEKQVELLITSVKSAIAETNSKNEEFATKITELNESIIAKDTEIENLNTQIIEANSKIEEKDKELGEVNSLVEQMKTELNQCKKDFAINELNQALTIFTDEEKAYAKDDIDLFNEDYTKVEVNSIITKINAGIGAKAKETQIAEINAAKNQPKLDDIFGSVDDVNTKDLVDLGDIFA